MLLLLLLLLLSINSKRYHFYRTLFTLSFLRAKPWTIYLCWFDSIRNATANANGAVCLLINDTRCQRFNGDLLVCAHVNNTSMCQLLANYYYLAFLFCVASNRIVKVFLFDSTSVLGMYQSHSLLPNGGRFGNKNWTVSKVKEYEQQFESSNLKNDAVESEKRKRKVIGRFTCQIQNHFLNRSCPTQLWHYLLSLGQQPVLISLCL